MTWVSTRFLWRQICGNSNRFQGGGSHESKLHLNLSCGQKSNISLAIAMLFSDISALPKRGENLQPYYKIYRQNLPIEKLQDY